MRLLIITQKVNRNDSNLGFFHRWLIEFSKNFEKVLVICLEEGDHSLPENVSVFSLGKEKGRSKLGILINFYKLVISKRNNYDSVFVHMNQVYLLLAGLLWEIWGKKVYLWYTHKSTPFSLKLAKNFADIVFTASKESFRLKTDNLMVTGHGIDTNLFVDSRKRVQNGVIKMLTAGRVSPTKNISLMIDVFNYIVKSGKRAQLKIVGNESENKEYLSLLNKKIVSLDIGNLVSFEGSKSQDQLVEYYNHSDIFLNFSNTGSLDKAVLEAMSCGLKVVTTNEAFKDWPLSFTNSSNFKVLADLVVDTFENKNQNSSREYIVENHNIEKSIEKISTHIQKNEN